ncbi:MAG: flagellar basal body rod protein FlgC [Clostridia bacterium]|nr:flagellar basal body rod protein FlgC [Clostridia bacterium]
MAWFQALSISGSGLTAQRLRLDLISSNLANMESTRGAYGGYYRRKLPVFSECLAQSLDPYAWGTQEALGSGVRVVAVVEDPSPPRLVYNPSHPDARPDGYVAYPNINVADEMVDMLTAARSYEANVTAFNAGKNIILKALEIGRG